MEGGINFTLITSHNNIVSFMGDFELPYEVEAEVRQSLADFVGRCEGRVALVTSGGPTVVRDVIFVACTACRHK